ncbi:TPA: TrbI/VirB10 family protein [Legionella pneumophila]|uniref:Conjugal transfer protein trbI n=1 Tax=Legionella pneumophila subsp. pneumophila TaxID=91891 RepID=A0AAV2UZR5_LEGPN|nr:TrbI/VirB10 family protein [Legionella pneumophila]AMQ28655.1 conjugal transfer protein TrbI [Legionella pneumophila subsp. pneumophila]ANN93355.1 conjugal transfer protein TrbI [Legionella pneumophila]MCH9063177.1 TrbI/VirB10 family protein [Legionella pneumophila serogroup 1]MCH9091255.1 TrbI/VirB10 family protein [Legionella pneumophila serogroup 1]MCH9132801.1 TrbI/VirB10 family protein [Legionella pneumophila serogroup 1]
MNQNNDYLSPDNSPKKLQTTGVKRVNNVPIIIAIGILTLFVVLIALVANKRANAQNQPPEIVKVKNLKKNTMTLANDVVGNHKTAVIPQSDAIADNETASLPIPEQPPHKEEILTQEVSEAEIERIRQEKTQEFEEAVKAKTSVMVDNPRLNNQGNSKISMNSNEITMNIDPSSAFKEQLALLQGRQAKPMPQTLGGEENEMRWHLNSTLQNPNSRYELRAGSVIPGVMISGISSELPGQIIAQVSQNVYDTATGKYLLIPQGTKILGLYSSDVPFGQSSVLVAWQRLVFPDSKALDIGSMPGADSAGYAGFRDQVDHHYARIYGSALLMSGIIAGITYSQNTNQSNQFGYAQPTAGSVMSQALGQQLGEVTSQLVSKNLNISPTINVRPGYRFNIIVVKDLTFKQPYRQFAY